MKSRAEVQNYSKLKGDRRNWGGQVSDHCRGPDNRRGHASTGKGQRDWERALLKQLAEQNQTLTTRQDGLPQTYQKSKAGPRPNIKEGRGEKKKRLKTHIFANGFQRRKVQFSSLSWLSGLNFTISSGNPKTQNTRSPRTTPKSSGHHFHRNN